jgi:plasmid stabilization system protein ParE
MPKVVFTPEADADLLAIGRSIAVDNPSGAVSFLAEIRRRCELRGPHSGAGERCQTPQRREIRRFSVGNYVVYFRPIDDGIEVLHVWHGARGRGPKL